MQDPEGRQHRQQIPDPEEDPKPEAEPTAERAAEKQ